MTTARNPSSSPIISSVSLMSTSRACASSGTSLRVGMIRSITDLRISRAEPFSTSGVPESLRSAEMHSAAGRPVRKFASPSAKTTSASHGVRSFAGSDWRSHGRVRRLMTTCGKRAP